MVLRPGQDVRSQRPKGLREEGLGGGEGEARITSLGVMSAVAQEAERESDSIPASETVTQTNLRQVLTLTVARGEGPLSP